jgi:subtilisin family serine protease
VSVAATDARGRLTPGSNFGSASVDVAAPGRSLLLAYPASQLPFQDGFESGLGSWSPSVGSGWSTSNAAATQGSFSMTDSPPSQPYSPAVQTSVEITLDLTGRFPCKLEFALLRRLEEGDQLHVEADGGRGQFGPLGPAVTGAGEEFERVTHDLAAISGRPGVRLRFRLEPDGDPAIADGVYIDEVVVRCFSPDYPRGPEVALVDGTSFAAGLVSGVAALLLSVDPAQRGVRLRDRLLVGAERLPALEALVSTGARIDALGALPLPGLSSLRVSPRSLRVAARAGFRASLPGRLAMVVERPRPGRRVRGRCVAPTARNRGARTCTRHVAVRRSSARVAAGRGSTRLARRVGRRTLPPGTYRLAATLVDGHGRRSRPARAAFRVVGAAR